MQLIKRWLTTLGQIKEYCCSHTALRVCIYGLIAAALLAAWVMSDGAGVAFVYNEF